MRNAVYLAIVLWFIRRILRKETPGKPGKAPEDNVNAIRYTPEEIEKMLVDGLQWELSGEIERIIDSKFPSWKEFV